MNLREKGRCIQKWLKKEKEKQEMVRSDVIMF